MADLPLEYLSIRVTVAHNRLNELLDLEVFKKADYYIAYPHTGKNGDNEHFHIFVPPGDKNYKQKFRDRIGELVGHGNSHLSLKLCKNGLGAAIQYGSKERTTPVTKGDVGAWIDNAPLWIPGGNGSKKRKRVTTLYDADGEAFDAGPRINNYNVVAYAANYYKRNNLKHCSWRKTLEAMLASRLYDFHITAELTMFEQAEFEAKIGYDTKGPLNVLFGKTLSDLHLLYRMMDGIEDKESQEYLCLKKMADKITNGGH